MNRRELLQVSTTAGLAVLASSALAVEAGHDAHAGHAGHEGHGASAHAALAAKAAACSSAAEACLTHCLATLAKGDTSLAECARTVRDTIAACDALRELAAADAPRLKAMATVVADICRDCEAQCRKHSEHETCKACGDSCDECARACAAA